MRCKLFHGKFHRLLQNVIALPSFLLTACRNLKPNDTLTLDSVSIRFSSLQEHSFQLSTNQFDVKDCCFIIPPSSVEDRRNMACSSYSLTNSKREPSLRSNTKLDLLADIANNVMDIAREIILRHYLARGNVFNTSNTNVFCWKSIAAEVETAMISIILKDLPFHALYSKLSGWNNYGGTVVPEFVWVLDPINGTPGGLLPTFGTLIASVTPSQESKRLGGGIASLIGMGARENSSLQKLGTSIC